MERCPVFRMSSLVGKRWTIPLLEEIGTGKGIGFNSLSRSLRNVTPKVLSQRLQQLEKEGIVSRHSESNPPRTNYTLTSRGEKLLGLVAAMKAWAEEEHQSIEGCSKRNCTECPFFS